MDPLTVHRFHFAFTVTFHYLFPQLTMGLALLIFALKTMALKNGNAHYNSAARFWAKIFGINFAVGVVTGIPMEFQFGTNWSRFAQAAGGVIGQTLAMEGVFSFFLESSFLGLFLYGEKRLSPRLHWLASLMVFLGSWLSGYFIIATDAWMQHPVGFERLADGHITLQSLADLLLNPWILFQYTHNMLGAVMTGSAVMASIGAYYLIVQKHVEHGKTFVRIGVIAGMIASMLLLMPTGDGQAKNIAKYQPATLAAMEGVYDTIKGAPIVFIGQPDLEHWRLDNPIKLPYALSFLTFRHWQAEVKGLRDFPADERPDNIELLYYSYHIMVGLGTIFIAVMILSLWKLNRGTLYTSRFGQWMLLLLAPFPYIANTAGWMTAELGRQPWLIHGLVRTRDGTSPYVTSGSSLFTLIGFMGMYTVLAILVLILVYREIAKGPEA